MRGSILNVILKDSVDGKQLVQMLKKYFIWFKISETDYPKKIPYVSVNVLNFCKLNACKSYNLKLLPEKKE